METYLIPIGENEELCERVQKALFAAGFERSLAAGGSATTVNDVSSGTLSLNRGGNGLFTRTSFNSRTFMSTEPSSDVLLAPSYVLAHASELDGAKKPWDVAEKGRRFVTADEMAKYRMPGHGIRFFLDENGGWLDVFGSSMHDGKWFPELSTYTVPIGFTFAPKQIEISMDAIAKMLDVDVVNLKITKESE